MLRTTSLRPYLYLAPAVALLGLVFAYPIIKVVDFSFRLIRGNSGPWVGLDNYRLVFEDPTFVDAAKHSAILLLAVPIMLVTSIGAAALLYDQPRGWKGYRSVLFLPFILAVPVVGIVASYVFQLNGALNTILRSRRPRAAGDRLDRQRALRPATTMFVIVWREVGFGVVLFLARMLSLDESQLEAARIEGAGWFQRLRHVILPELRGAIEFYVVIASITMLAWVFAYVFTLTAGGPGTATTVLELYIYNTGVRNSLPGMASAVAVLLLLVTTLLVGILFALRARSLRRGYA